MNALLAHAAPPGATIGIVTPASPPETRAEVQRAIAWWESKGYRAKLMPGALEQDVWHAGSPEVRARDLQAAFADPDIDAIQTMRGGYGSAQMIPLLDFDAIAETPKMFVGLSDKRTDSDRPGLALPRASRKAGRGAWHRRRRACGL
jgi:muramoyltetrapeptide carboxypeptidase